MGVGLAGFGGDFTRCAPRACGCLRAFILFVEKLFFFVGRIYFVLFFSFRFVLLFLVTLRERVEKKKTQR